MIKNCIIIFTGFNQRAVIAFIRTLVKFNIKYALIAKSKEDTIFYSIYKKNVVAVRKSLSLDLNDLLLTIDLVKSKIISQNYFIAPSTEALNRFLLANIKAFENKNITVPLVTESLYNLLSDKYSFDSLCRKYKIAVPEKYDAVDRLSVPFVAKPYRYFSSKDKVYSPFLILNEKDKLSFFNECDSEDFYYQKYVNGMSYYLLYYFYRNGKICKFSQKNIAQQPQGKSIVAAVPACLHKKEISLQYEQMLSDIGFHGLIMIEVREADGKYYMIEANPRFWGPSQLFVDAGMNFFEAFLHDYNIIDKNPDFSLPDNQIKYFWYGGIQNTIAKSQSIVYHSEQYGNMFDRINEWLQYDIYKRNDTMKLFTKELNDAEMAEKEALIKLYAQTSKHSNYQILPEKLTAIIGDNEIQVRSRYESERLDYFLKHINFKNKTVLDIGGNTGYFSFELLDKGAKSVQYYDGNKAHSDFVKLAAKILHLSDKLLVRNAYYSFEKEKGEYSYGIILLLNVLHHIGDDYGDKKISLINAKKEILKELNNLAYRAKIMIFQLGFNWKGNRNMGLFENGTKSEMIDFIRNGSKDYWEILKIGIAEKNNKAIEYKNMNNANIKRNDAIGEFLNRPIFILKSKIER